MRPMKTLLKLQEESGGPPTQSMTTPLRVKKTRKLGHIDPKAKKRMLLRRMRSKANTRQRKGTSLKAAVRAETRVGGQKAERRATSIKVTTEEVAQGAKTEMLVRKKGSPNLITVKIEIRVMSLIKSRTPKEEMVRERGRGQRARKDRQQKMGTDLEAGTGTGADVKRQKTKKKNEKRTKRGAESVAGVTIDDTTAKGKIRGEDHPEIRNVEQEVQTETSRETRKEAGGPGARVIGETTAKIGHLIGRTRTETLPTKGEDIAAALRVIEMRKGRVRRAQIPNGEQGANPKTEEAQPSQDQIVQKAKTEMTARGINRAQAQAQALTATEPVTIS